MVTAGASAHDQAEVAAFLADPARHGPGVAAVERIETHAAIVFLAGDYAYKMKRAVCFPFLDFSTLAKRRHACEREIAFNRRTAPTLYIGVVAVCRDADGRLVLDGPGEPVEWLVRMRRFEQDGLFDRMARDGRLAEAHIDAMADAVIALHRSAERFQADALATGACGGLRISAQETLGGLVDHPELFAPARSSTLIAAAGAALERLTPLLERRCADGWLRRCHGDLHLRNICLIDGRPTLFDCIEFNDALACIDVFYDLAFLLMDLCHRGLRHFANRVLNRCLADDAHDDALAALPFFLALRAGIRAWVDATSSVSQPDPDAAAALRSEAQRYFAEAEFFLKPPPARLVAIGGFSGSGKSTLARSIASDLGAAPGALILRSDVIRKSLCGVAETERLPAAAYAPEISARVYAVMHARAGRTLAAGHAVILDAVHDREADRRTVEAIAQKIGVVFDGLWLDAPRERLARQIEMRRRDASDADVRVLAHQLERGAGTIGWQLIDAGVDPASVARAVRVRLGIA